MSLPTRRPDAHLGSGQRSCLIGAQHVHGGNVLQGAHAGDDGVMVLAGDQTNHPEKRVQRVGNFPKDSETSTRSTQKLRTCDRWSTNIRLIYPVRVGHLAFTPATWTNPWRCANEISFQRSSGRSLVVLHYQRLGGDSHHPPQQSTK